MQKLLTFIFALGVLSCGRTLERPENLQAGMIPVNTKTMESEFYNFKLKDLDGKEVDFEQFKGKKNPCGQCSI